MIKQNSLISHFPDTKKKYGSSGSYNNSKRDDLQINAWNSRRLLTENSTPPVQVCCDFKILAIMIIE